MVGRLGLDPADGSDLWFMAHPKEEPLNHSLATVRHRAHRARVTRDHRIKSPSVSPLITISYNSELASTTRNEGAYWPPGSPRIVVSCCQELAFVEFKCTRSAPWGQACRSS